MKKFLFILFILVCSQVSVFATNYFELGNQNLEKENYKSAIQYYTKDLIENNQNSASYWNRGLSKHNIKDYKGAIQDYNIAIKLEPNEPILYSNRAISEIELGDYKQAIADCNKSLNLNSKNDNAYYYRGLANNKLHHYIDALRDYNKALSLNHKSPAKYNIHYLFKDDLDNKFNHWYYYFCFGFIFLCLYFFYSDPINVNIPNIKKYSESEIQKAYVQKYPELKLDSPPPILPNMNQFEYNYSRLKEIKRYSEMNIFEVLRLEKNILGKILIACILIVYLYTNDLFSATIPFWGQVLILTIILYKPIKYIQIKYLISEIPKYNYTEDKVKHYLLYKGIRDLYNKNMEILKEQKEQLEKQKRSYWKKKWSDAQKNGFEFENEVGDLYRKLGYKVTVTKGTGDGGVDLIMKKDGIITIVQCKAHKQQVGPEPVRALWGVKDDFNADNVIFVAYAGITGGAWDFVRNKDYKVIDVNDLIDMSLKLKNGKNQC